MVDLTLPYLCLTDFANRIFKTIDAVSSLQMILHGAVLGYEIKAVQLIFLLFYQAEIMEILNLFA